MKKIELLGLSVVAAALIMTTGCSSDEDSASGPSAPSESAAPVEMNVTSVKNAFYLIGNAQNGLNRAPAFAKVAKLASLAAQKTTTGESDPNTVYCQIEGTQTWTWSSQETSFDPEEGQSSTYQDNVSVTFDNCVDNYSGVNFIGEPLNQEVTNGTFTLSTSDDYDADKNVTKETQQMTYDLYMADRSDTTKASVVTTIAFTVSEDKQYDGTHSRADKINYHQSQNINGEYKMYHTDANGNTVPDVGEREVAGNLVRSRDIVYDATTATETEEFKANGFYADYETNSTGEHVMDSQYYNGFDFKDVRVEYAPGENNSSTTVSGTIGSRCMGGSVNISVNPVIESSDSIPNVPGDTLPYSGGIKLVGSSTAAITFSKPTATTTAATIVTTDGNSVANSWSELADEQCVPHR